MDRQASLKALSPDAQWEIIRPRFEDWLWYQVRNLKDADDLFSVGQIGAWEAMVKEHGNWSPVTLARRGAAWAIQEWSRRQNAFRIQLSNTGGPRNERLRQHSVVLFGDIWNNLSPEDGDGEEEILATRAPWSVTPDFVPSLVEWLDHDEKVRLLWKEATITQILSLELVYFQGLTLEEAARHLNKSLSAVQQNIAWALNLYRKAAGMPERGVGNRTNRQKKGRAGNVQPHGTALQSSEPGGCRG